MKEGKKGSQDYRYNEFLFQVNEVCKRSGRGIHYVSICIKNNITPFVTYLPRVLSVARGFRECGQLKNHNSCKSLEKGVVMPFDVNEVELEW